MTPDFILKGCNPSQKEAILFDHSQNGPLLILAGAGSGKTAVLTKRILWLSLCQGIPSKHILGLTFTAKAAGEMRERLETAIPNSQCNLCTFHSFSLQLIRDSYCGKTGWARLGFSKKPVLTENGGKGWETLVLRAGIPKKALPREDLFSTKKQKTRWGRKVQGLQKQIMDKGELVFEDLIWLAIRLLKYDSVVSDLVHQRVQYLLVDEYQDINPSQYQLVRLLIGDRPNLFVVGDDDQAIYGFRGADIGNILRFRKDYPNCRVLKMEWNYRSTPSILEVANRIFPEKTLALRKRLRPGSSRQDILFQKNSPVEVLRSDNPLRELDVLISKILKLRKDYSLPWSAFAILVRYNRQREWYSYALNSRGLPVQIGDIEGIRTETIHASKGLQYPVVFYAGMALGISPGTARGSRQQIQKQLEEEKRLFYVGVTRAESRLYLLFCKRRFWQGTFCEFQESPYLNYVPRKEHMLNVAKISILFRIACYMAWALCRVFWERLVRPRSLSLWVENELDQWARFCLRITGYQLNISGQSQLASVDWSRPVFVVSNHQSYMDIPAVLVSLERKLGFIAKRELGRIPLLGFWMLRIGCLLIERGKAGVAQDVALAIKRMEKAPNLVVFPEGTRSKNGELGKFKSGAFRMAIDHKAILVPMVLTGTRQGWEARQTTRSSFEIRSRILSPLDCELLLQENGQLSHRDLMALVRERMESELQATAE